MVKLHYIGVLGSMVRGEHFNGKRDFLDLEGIFFIVKELEKNCSIKKARKFLTIINDLVQNDHRLGNKINDGTKYMNTDVKNNNDDQKDYSKYEHLAKKQLLERDFPKVLLPFFDNTDL